jgi:hypothetical protein
VRTHRTGRRDRGQATLELLAALPFLLIMAALLLQLAAVVWVVTDTTDAARQGARASSMGQDGCGAARAALSGAMPGEVLSCSSGGGTVRLAVSAPVMVPGIPDVTVRREAQLPDLADR